MVSRITSNGCNVTEISFNEVRISMRRTGSERLAELAVDFFLNGEYPD